MTGFICHRGKLHFPGGGFYLSPVPSFLSPSSVQHCLLLLILSLFFDGIPCSKRFAIPVDNDSAEQFVHT
jgi:hypothetical protein